MDQIDKSLWINKLWDPLEKIEDSPLHSKREGIKVAAYCRVSLDSLGLSHSLESQVSHYTHVINSRDNWTFVGIYFDNLVTGRKASLRRGFTRMLRHCEEGKIDLILVKNVSRFSRNAKELIEVIERLKELNVTVYFETENIESTRSDTTYLLKTYASIAQGELESVSQSIEWGHERRIMKGIAKLGPLYGYNQTKFEDGNVVTINQEQAEIVKEIFQMYMKGYSFNGIAAELTRRGVSTYYGKVLWRSSTIKSILTNISYTGDALTRKTTRDLISNETRPSEGIRDQYLIENHHPPIISKAIFSAVQERITEKHVNQSPRSIRINPLAKRVQCGNCGYALHKSYSDPWNYFKCSSSRTSIYLCTTPTIREDVMLEMMLEALKKRFDTENKNILKILSRFLIRINQNDHFEFHRLKALTQIQLAKSLRGVKFNDEDITLMEQEYQQFEKRLEKIEDDRKYRIAAIEWLEKINDFNDFKETMNLEYMRAWITDLVIYSKDDFKVYWVDGVDTEMGCCIPIEQESEPFLRFKSNDKLQLSPSELANQNIIPEQIISREGGDSYDKEEGRMIADRTMESASLVKSIRKQLTSSVVMQTNVPVVRKEKIKVAAYVRVSTEQEQQLISLKTQYSYYLYLILKNPHYDFAGIYMDEGKSGTTTKGRSEFKRMIDDCSEGKIDLIITKSISRFARNTVDTLKYLKLLKELNPPVNVWFERENLFSLNEKSGILIKLLSAIGQEESVNISESIAWGKRSLAQRGIVRPARVGYGYMYGDNKQWLINKEEAKIVHMIYDLFESGKNYHQIRDILTERKIPTPGGQKHWCASTIIRILTAEEYRGNYIYQKTHTGTELEKKRMINKGQLPMYYVEHHHEPIIESERWEKVQDKIKIAQIERQNNVEEYPEDTGKNEVFSKRLYCSKCGGVVGYSRAIYRQKENHEIRWWRCSRALKGRCDSISMKQEYLEENFVQMLIDLKQNREFWEYLDSFKESIKITEQEKEVRICLEAEIEALNRQIFEAVEGELTKRGKDAILIDHLTESIMGIRQTLNSFNKREDQLEAIEVEIKELGKVLDKIKSSKKDDLNFYKNSPKFQHELFESFIEKATVEEDGRITFQFTSGLEWGADLNYSDFQKLEIRRKVQKWNEEKEKFLWGPEIDRLLEYCKEPKSLFEMVEYLGKYKSKDAFSRNILHPLLGQGRIKRTIPERLAHKFQKYYSVNAEND